MADALNRIIEYHQVTKHRPNAYARGPGALDWASEPNSFRRFIDVGSIPLNRIGTNKPNSGPAPLDIHSLSSLFYNSLSLSAWKSARGSKWSQRVNPSSGDLHPTECYLISGKIEASKAQWESIIIRRSHMPWSKGRRLRSIL